MSIWAKILEFNDRYFPNWRATEPIYYSNALAGEAGEICNAIKHMIGGGTNRISADLARKKAIAECVDVTIYRTLLLERLGVDEVSFDIWFERVLARLRERMEAA
jgi:NTP pyrophosphatase (non-canonical NTP hydrolase)